MNVLNKLLTFGLLICLIGSCKKQGKIEITRPNRMYFAKHALVDSDMLKTQISSSMLGLGEKLSWRISSFPGAGSEMESFHPEIKDWERLRYSKMNGMGEFYCNPRTWDCEIFAVIGRGTIFEEKNRFVIKERRVPPSTLLIIEIQKPIEHWMMSIDLDVIELSNDKSMLDRCVDQTSLWAAFADGLVVNFHGAITGQDLASLALPESTSLEMRADLIDQFGIKSIPSERPTLITENFQVQEMTGNGENPR